MYNNYYNNMGYPDNQTCQMGSGYQQSSDYPAYQQQLLMQQQQQAMMIQQQRDMFLAQQRNIEQNFYNKMMNAKAGRAVYPRTVDEKEYYLFCQLGCQQMGETVHFTNIESFPLTEAVFTIKDNMGRIINAQKQIGIKHACKVRQTFMILPVKNEETGYPYITIPVADGRWEKTQVCYCEACNKLFHTAFTPA